MGRLAGIGVAHVKRAPLVELTEAEISPSSGIAGDARGATPGRQVTLLFRESWESACRDVGVTLPWLTRRANLLVEGMEVPHKGRLRIGTAVLEVTGETTPCRLMEAAQAGLREALKPEWRGGVCCRVVSGGKVRVGETIELV